MPRWKLRLIQFGRLLAHPLLWYYLRHWLTRYIAAWLLTLAGGGTAMYFAWTSSDNASRGDHNGGHTTIDFGGQYLMGRMLAEGQGRHLYHRGFQRRVLLEAYPREDEDPSQTKGDADSLMGWFMGEDHPPMDGASAGLSPLAAATPLELAILLTRLQQSDVASLLSREQHSNDDAIGGPLYPPVNALLYYPLALLAPQPAYRVIQIINLLLAFVAGLGIQRLSQGRIWWPVAIGAVLAFPGFGGSLFLGQNATLTLALLIWGWVLIALGRPTAGGFIWGLLAFKPVWALNFFLVLILARRWRVAAAMGATGMLLALLTVPFVGVASWFDWLQVGAEATETYKADSNWIHLSRDLLSIPRRWLTFDSEPQRWYERRDDLPTTIVGWAMLIAVAELTVRVAVMRRQQLQAPTGPVPAFLLLAAWLCCFHFMYYDTLLAALPFFLLFTEPRRYLEPVLVAIMHVAPSHLNAHLIDYYQPHFARHYPSLPTQLRPAHQHILVLNRVEPTLAVVLLIAFPLVALNLYVFPYDTLVLLVLWLWCGWICLYRDAGQSLAPSHTTGGAETTAGASQSSLTLPLAADGQLEKPCDTRSVFSSSP
jgi:hypothetical protein